MIVPKYSCWASANIEGANGRNHSRCFDAGVQYILHMANPGEPQWSDCRARAVPIPCAPETSPPRCPSPSDRSQRRAAERAPAGSTSRLRFHTDSIWASETRGPGRHDSFAPSFLRAASAPRDTCATRPDHEAFIAGGRLNPGAAEWRSRKQFAVGHAVEGTASRHGEIFFGNGLCSSFARWKTLPQRHVACVGQVHIALRIRRAVRESAE